MVWSWSWSLGNSASWGDNPVFDWVRAACVVFGVMLFLGVGRVLVEARRRPESMPLTQVARFAALALADLSLSLTEVSVAGTPATPRLVVNVAALALGAYGVWGIRRKQRNTPPTF